MSGKRAKRERATAAKAKRHHVVPQAYLKAWADTSNRVRVFDGQAGRVFITDTKNAAVRSKLYTLRLPDGTEDDGLETEFANVESELVEVLRDLRAGQWPLNDHGRSLMANFIALQIARAPGIPEAIDRMLDEVTDISEKMQTAMDRMKAELTPEEYAKQAALWSAARGPSADKGYTLEEFVEMHRYPTLGALAAMSELVEPIANLRFTLLRSSDEEFLTCDQPIAHWPMPGQPEWMGTGLLNAQWSTLPISPTMCLQFQVPGSASEPLNGCREVSRLEAALVNHRTLRSASRHIVMRPDCRYFGLSLPG